MSKCKHPIKDIAWRWVNKSGSTIQFSAGSNKIKQEYTCMNCIKTFTRIPKRIKESYEIY